MVVNSGWGERGQKTQRKVEKALEEGKDGRRVVEGGIKGEVKNTLKHERRWKVMLEGEEGGNKTRKEVKKR